MNTIKKLVIVGGGTAGWLSAALAKKILADTVDITLVESEDIGTVGVGEATIPPIRTVNSVLGLDEATFLKETKATVKLAIKFENWKQKGQSYYHTFGAPGKSTAFCHFHHYWTRAKQAGHDLDIWQYDLNYLCAEAGKFAQINAKDPILELPFAYHFDAGLYAKYLRKYCEELGVTRVEGKITSVTQNPENGYVTTLHLERGEQIDGDLFMDCSGFKGLLIEQTLGTGYDDWSHLLPCDSALAVPSERHDKTAPYTRSIAHKAGWQWRIPLQHRNGNGHVYCSRYISDDEAASTLMGNLDTKPLGEPKLIRFKTGRRRKQWNKNVVAIGLSSGFLEPLESTSIHLIQSGIIRLLHLFPHDGIRQASVDEYNRQSQTEFEQIRNFLILHYYLNERKDEPFWRDMRNLELPALLVHKMELFKAQGKLFRDENDLFLDSSWLQVMMGQGLEPSDYHPLANAMPLEGVNSMLQKMQSIKNEPLSQLPNHDDYIASMLARAK